MDPTAQGAWGYAAPSDPFAHAQGYAVPPPVSQHLPGFQEKVLVPRPWVAKRDTPPPTHDPEDDEYTPAAGGGRGDRGGGGADDKETGTKRGNYRCGRCGQLKKGHVCTNKPRLRTALVETAESEAQVEMDEDMTLRTLNLKLQGYPESYGLSFRWGGGGTTPAPYTGTPRGPGPMPGYAPQPGYPPMQAMAGGGGGVAPPPMPGGYAMHPTPHMTTFAQDPQQSQPARQMPPYGAYAPAPQAGPTLF